MLVFSNISPLARSGILLSSGLFIFGFGDNLIILISSQVSVGQFHFSRSIVACLAVLIFASIAREQLIPKNWKAVLVRTFFNVVAMLLYFGVIPMMPIAEAGAGLFTSPIFVLLFSFLIFREKITLRQFFSFLLGMLGVFLILGTNFDSFTLYHILPVIAGASYALGAITTNRYCSDEKPLALLFCFLIAIGIVGLVVTIWFTYFPVGGFHLSQAPFIFKSWQQTNTFYWAIITFLGLSATLAIYLIIMAYQICKPSYSAIYEYTYLLSVGFFGWLIWGSVPSFLSSLGIIAIIAAGANIALIKSKVN